MPNKIQIYVQYLITINVGFWIVFIMDSTFEHLFQERVIVDINGVTFSSNLFSSTCVLNVYILNFNCLNFLKLLVFCASVVDTLLEFNRTRSSWHLYDYKFTFVSIDSIITVAIDKLSNRNMALKIIETLT